MKSSSKDALMTIITDMLKSKGESKSLPLLITYPELVSNIRELLNELIADNKIGYGKTLNSLFITTRESLNKQKELES